MPLISEEKIRPFSCLAKIERFYTEPITREEDYSFILIVNGKGPHAIEPFHAAGPPLLISVNYDLGICI